MFLYTRTTHKDANPETNRKPNENHRTTMGNKRQRQKHNDPGTTQEDPVTDYRRRRPDKTNGWFGCPSSGVRRTRPPTVLERWDPSCPTSADCRPRPWRNVGLGYHVRPRIWVFFLESADTTCKDHPDSGHTKDPGIAWTLGYPGPGYKYTRGSRMYPGPGCTRVQGLPGHAPIGASGGSSLVVPNLGHYFGRASPAVLTVKIIIRIQITPPDPPQKPKPLKENNNPDPPSESPGGGGQGQK